MAGRFLLIEFDDEATASRLREQIDAATRKGKPYRVTGLFARPSGFCSCESRVWINDRTGASKTKVGAKFGWVVCTECKRPLPLMSFLKNLIAPSDIIQPTRHDMITTKGQHIDVGFYSYGLTATALENFKGN